MNYSFIFTIIDFYSTDETSTENLLKSLQTFASVSGRVGLTVPRDAFISCLCKASLPPHYSLNVFNVLPTGVSTGRGIEFCLYYFDSLYSYLPFLS